MDINNSVKQGYKNIWLCTVPRTRQAQRYSSNAIQSLGCGAQKGIWVSSENWACKKVWVVICLIHPNLFSHLLWGLLREEHWPSLEASLLDRYPGDPKVRNGGQKVNGPKERAAPMIARRSFLKGRLNFPRTSRSLWTLMFWKPSAGAMVACLCFVLVIAPLAP